MTPSGDPTLLASTLLLLVFAVLAGIDGVYVHLVKLRLHQRAASWGEHVWHTASALVFAPLLAALFLFPSGGLLLWAGVALLVLLHVVEALDVRSEKASREPLGGLSRGELAIHLGAFATRSAAVGLSLWSRPLSAWSLDAPSRLGSHPPIVESLMLGLVAGAAGLAVLHVVLAWRHRPEGAFACCSSEVAA